MDSKLLEILVCPVTKGPLVYDRDKQELVSKSARLAYPIRDGIPVMLEDEARKLTPEEAAAAIVAQNPDVEVFMSSVASGSGPGCSFAVMSAGAIGRTVVLSDTFAFRAFGRVEAVVPSGVLFVFTASAAAPSPGLRSRLLERLDTAATWRALCVAATSDPTMERTW